MRRIIQRLTLIAAVCASPVVEAQTFTDYFQPMPIINSLTSNGWGASNVQPRDQDNGLEDKTNQSYSYWDGRIVKAADGKFHMLASRWSQSSGHNGWFGSSCVHAVSDSNILGPYVDKGLCYDDANGQGHNVMASQLPDGRYFILVSETRRPAVIYTSTSLDGPWTKAGTITTEANGFRSTRARGKPAFEHHHVGSAGRQHSRDVTRRSHHAQHERDPRALQGSRHERLRSQHPVPRRRHPRGSVLWYSGCQYHMVYSYPLDRKSYHLASADGIKNWVNAGLAYDATKPFIKYTDGTANTWNKLERPQVYLEDGHVKYFNFAVIDVDKGNDAGNDNHNSKVIVVPFDGVLFDQETGLTGCASGTGGAGGGPAAAGVPAAPRAAGAGRGREHERHRWWRWAARVAVAPLPAVRPGQGQ